MDSVDTDIDIVKFVHARKKEIDLLMHDAFLGKENKHKSLFQMLPRHMRRRTMGYLRKRLPHRIRQSAVIKPPAKASKRPSRKHRRRVENLVKEYERRKRATDDKMWLETHIWHAKRFHMSESLYGYRLPVHDNVKCMRAVLKCLRKYCCMHDESYHVCFELVGTQHDLITGLSNLCSTDLGFTFDSKSILNGQFEGSVILYKSNKYPYSCIGPCRFMWMPNDDQPSDETQRRIWLWVHPSIHQKFLQELVDLFGLVNVNEDTASTNLSNQTEDSPAVKKRKLDGSKQSCDSIVFSNAQKTVKLTNLKDKFVRFKLLGPLSTTILGNVLNQADFSELETNNVNERYQKQGEFWTKTCLNDPLSVTFSTVLGLLVKDPRMFLPKKKSFNKMYDQMIKKKEKRTTQKERNSQELTSYSTLWDRDVTASLNQIKKKTREINKIRSNYLMPGTRLTQVENYCQIPVLLVKTNGISNMHTARNANLFSGWDLIVPQGWAMSFWLTLNHLGARAIGQRELNYLMFESGVLQFPSEFGDTRPGQDAKQSQCIEQYQKHVRRPPSKRVNYFKLGFLTPFLCPWQSLVYLRMPEKLGVELNDQKELDFYILRNRKALHAIKNLLFNRNKQAKIPKLSFSENEMSSMLKSYIGVRLLSVGKGTIDQFSLLYAKSCQKETSSIESSEATSNERYVINKLISSRKKQVQSELELSGKVSADGANLKKLMRINFNKSELLKSEASFFKMNQELLDSQTHLLPIGFVCNGGYTLVAGGCTANAFILTNHLIDLVSGEKMVDYKPRTTVSYKTPSARLTRNARIVDFYI